MVQVGRHIMLLGSQKPSLPQSRSLVQRREQKPPGNVVRHMPPAPHCALIVHPETRAQNPPLHAEPARHGIPAAVQHGPPVTPQTTH